uniref:Uncharacterized protein n=1 Tax=Maylandia zebra TaxID=106582 RepID=A0A3P9C5G2_9CICH
CVIVTAVCTAAGAIGAVVTAPALLGAAGFNSAGIAAGSCAAGMMSSAAASNGGEVTAGGVVAVLHSSLAAAWPALAISCASASFSLAHLIFSRRSDRFLFTGM